MNELIAINAALALVESLIPRIADLVRRGEISADKQAELRARFEALRDKRNEHFTGPEWVVE